MATFRSWLRRRWPFVALDAAALTIAGGYVFSKAVYQARRAAQRSNSL